jgi:hypothetical protein
MTLLALHQIYSIQSGTSHQPPDLRPLSRSHAILGYGHVEGSARFEIFPQDPPQYQSTIKELKETADEKQGH